MHYLLVNPPVYDFAAYDYWLKPLGLLYISAILKDKGNSVDFIDCMDRSRPEVDSGPSGKYGKGGFESRPVPVPEAVSGYKRKYSVYGLSGEKFYKALKSFNPPDKIFLSSAMTYWYPGVKEAAEQLKRQFPEAELVLGGTYPALMKEHARRNICADRIVSEDTANELSTITGSDITEFDGWPPPDYSGYRFPGYIVIRTSAGCPYSCSYCGIKNIYKGFKKKTAEKIRGEINDLYKKHRLKDFVFYDDALLKNRGFKDIFKGLPAGLRFHTPNGLEVDEVTPDIAGILKKSNFIEPCLAADVIDRDIKSSAAKKLTKENIEKAASSLLTAGYRKGEISAYLILGLPGDTLENVRLGAQYLHSLGLKVKLAEYALVPGSEDAKYFSREIRQEPLLHNNSLFPSFPVSRWEEIFNLKRYVNKLNDNF